MYDKSYFDEQTLYKFFVTLTEIKGVGPELAGRIITETQNNGFLIRELPKPTDPSTPTPKTYRGLSVVDEVATVDRAHLRDIYETIEEAG